jgi:hypothetical protein
MIWVMILRGRQGTPGKIRTPDLLIRSQKCLYLHFDALGREVAILVEADEAAGLHSVIWDGRGETGVELANGSYFYRLVSGGVERSGRIVLAR